MNAVWLSLAALVSTSAGGLCALHLRPRLHLVLGFSAGVVLGVVAFDLLPESLEQSRRLNGSAMAGLLALLAGFVSLHALKRYVFPPHAHARDSGSPLARAAGVPQALALVAHSALDGVSMGLAFQVSPAVGLTDVYAATIPDFPFEAGVHVNYQETRLHIHDGLPKLQDLPKEMGGTGVAIGE